MTDTEQPQLTRELLDQIHAQLIRYGSCRSTHEDEIVLTMENARKNQEELNKVFGRGWRIKDHYGRGAKHPDDYNLPINLWDSTD